MSGANVFCPHCGAATQSDWVHCSACGGVLQPGTGAQPKDEPRSRKRTWILATAVVAALLVVAAGLWLGSQALNARSFESWMTTTEAAEKSMEAFKAEREAATDAWQKRTNDGANANEAAYNTWQETVAESAATHVATLKVQQHDMEEMSFLPWQGSISVARDDYIDHISAWVGYLEDLSRMNAPDDYDAAYMKNTPDIEATFEIARKSVYAAVPSLFAGDLQRRVDAEFAE